MRSKTPLLLLTVLAVAWHLFALFSPPEVGSSALKNTMGRDFASYYYAARVAATGENPWDTAKLSATAREDGTRTKVHPFFYPPPYLLLVSWAPATDLQTAYELWFWLQELALIGVLLVLWLWWRPLGPSLPAALALWTALMWGIAYGHVMGQVNGVILLLVVAAMWQGEAGRHWIAGPLLAAACMFKMSPALFVLYWLLKRRWQAVAITLGSAVLLSVITLPLVGFSHQLHFYTQVLPGFGNGDYNGLIVKIGMFANHSVPNVLDQLFPGTDNQISATAGALGSAFSVLSLAGLGVLFRAPNTSPLQTGAQVSAVAVLSLLIPVYTYEHHLIWTLPALVIVSVALFQRRLHLGWLAVLVLCAVAFAWPLPHLKALSWSTFKTSPMPRLALQELKFVALFALFAATTWLGASSQDAESTT